MKTINVLHSACAKLRNNPIQCCARYMASCPCVGKTAEQACAHVMIMQPDLCNKGHALAFLLTPLFQGSQSVVSLVGLAVGHNLSNTGPNMVVIVKGPAGVLTRTA